MRKRLSRLEGGTDWMRPRKRGCDEFGFEYMLPEDKRGDSAARAHKDCIGWKPRHTCPDPKCPVRAWQAEQGWDKLIPNQGAFQRGVKKAPRTGRKP